MGSARKGLPGNRHSQAVHESEVGLGLMSGLMILGKHHLFQLTVVGSPLLEPSLERPQLSFLELPLVDPIQVVKNSCRLHGWRLFQDLIPSLSGQTDS